MNRLTFLCCLCLVGYSYALPAQGPIEFQDISFQHALTKASETNKILFIDAYTTWCAPCITMEKEVFSDPEISSFFNANFLNLKIDMEKGFGKQIAERYQVTAFPTFLFLDGSGAVVHRSTGFLPKNKFQQLAETALDPDRNLKGMARRFLEGDRDPDFLYTYAATCMLAMDDSTGAQVADAYMATQDNWDTPQNRAFIFTFLDDPDSEIFDYFIRHRLDFEQQFGSEMVNNRLQKIILQASFSKDGDDEASFKKIDRLYQKAYPEQADQLLAQFKLNYYSYQGNADQFAEAAIHYYQNFEAQTASELNNIAWQFYEKYETVDKLKFALEWAEKSVSMDARYYNMDTLAWIYYKMGNKQKAKEMAERAIRFAKAMGDDYSTTQKLLDQL